MISLSFVVGVIGNIISVFFFLSPLSTFCRKVRNRSIEEFESFPYISTLLSCTLWTYYGVTNPGSFLVATINGFGVVVELIYVALFLIFAPPRIRAKTGILFGLLDVGFVAATVLVTQVKTVTTTKSVEYMPFLLSLFVFFNGAIWTLYAVLVKDIFLGVPNGIGLLLGIAQLLLYVMYSRKRSITSSGEWKISERLVTSSSKMDEQIQGEINSVAVGRHAFRVTYYVASFPGEIMDVCMAHARPQQVAMHSPTPLQGRQAILATKPRPIILATKLNPALSCMGCIHSWLPRAWIASIAGRFLHP
ncbi:Nodulin MtN3 family protein isoform 1 [Hibiscus syriacus]|uniref:Bidirectional sugar transporter SWEET n=1 Tax=Hibiscus syriacus TaxID=106335 RepID=A0A6A2XUG3_HIBSY|nr:Nodulin MtN3 family protein isoform 1 [Hibiscus syriacus]